jgi:hypothetical protein
MQKNEQLAKFLKSNGLKVGFLADELGISHVWLNKLDRRGYSKQQAKEITKTLVKIGKEIVAGGKSLKLKSHP